MGTKKPLCGAQPVMYTYPAWSFAGKHDKGYVPPGPGVGSLGTGSTLGTSGPVFGHSSHASNPSDQTYGDGCATGESYLKPGYLSQQPRTPAYTFGGKYRSPMDSSPVPASYDTIAAARSSMRSAPTSSWGPPPRPPQPSSSPRVWRDERPAPSKTKGPSFGLAWAPDRTAPSPGPLDYQCECGGGCCRACQAYSGVSFKGRRPVMYGKVTTVTPGPTAYHTGCSTIGVAAAPCVAASSNNGPVRARNSRR